MQLIADETTSWNMYLDSILTLSIKSLASKIVIHIL